MIADARSKDDTNAVNHNYSVKGTGSELQMVRKKTAIKAWNEEEQPWLPDKYSALKFNARSFID